MNSGAPFHFPLFLVLFSLAPAGAESTGGIRQVPPLTAAQELETIELPDGYRLELVLSEPDIKEPVLAVFDGNGRMYVAEMRSYMQDIDAKDQFAPVSRISRHESTKGDGVFDRHDVFLDGLLLPRMVLPMDDRVLVGLTNSNDLTLHRDRDGNGTADESIPWYSGGPRGGNLEHQPSGLVWGLDNWIYTTYNSYRLRWNGTGAPLEETTAANGGQWGVSQDDYGKMWWSNAGGEKGLWNYQVPILYGAINLASQKPADFDNVWPLVALGDFQGGTKRFQSPENKALNVFTGCGGQTVFRGDRLPGETRGNVFLPEPVGRLIRRATVTVEDGITKVANPHGRDEFIRSSDPNFRPIHATTGPDGCLYIVDMYRGIIQEGGWTKKGSFLRERILENGMENITGRGRIWRLVHKDFKPGPPPRMLEEEPARWVAHLAHPNGWWRDTAQRLLILKNDASVLPALTAMADSHGDHLARIHALWTIEGMAALTAGFVSMKMEDLHPKVRVQAIRAAETLLKKPGDHSALVARIAALAGDRDPEVVLQTIMTSKVLKWPDWKASAQKIIASSSSHGVRDIGEKLFAAAPSLAGTAFSPQQRSAIERGHQIYSSLCFACHGSDAMGMPMSGDPGTTLAPPLAGSKTVAQGDSLVRVLLHGLSGPVNGRTYESEMVAMGNNPDSWLADITSYLRVSFGNNGAPVSPEEVARIRAANSSRGVPWTIGELRAFDPQEFENRPQWTLSSSHHPETLAMAVDGDPATRWSTGKTDGADAWLTIELPQAAAVAGLVLEHAKSPRDFPLKYQIELSQDGRKWEPPILRGNGTRAVNELHFPGPAHAKFIRITRTALSDGAFWSIHELHLLAPPANRSKP